MKTTLLHLQIVIFIVLGRLRWGKGEVEDEADSEGEDEGESGGGGEGECGGEGEGEYYVSAIVECTDIE